MGEELEERYIKTHEVMRPPPMDRNYLLSVTKPRRRMRRNAEERLSLYHNSNGRRWNDGSVSACICVCVCVSDQTPIWLLKQRKGRANRELSQRGISCV